MKSECWLSWEYKTQGTTNTGEIRPLIGLISMDLYWAVRGKIRNKAVVQVLENRKDSNFRKGVNSQSLLDDIWLSYRGRAADTIASSLSPREQVMSSVAGEWEKKLNPWRKNRKSWTQTLRGLLLLVQGTDHWERPTPKTPLVQPKTKPVPGQQKTPAIPTPDF